MQIGWLSRYRSDRMMKIWSEEEKFNIWRDIEVAVLEGWAKLGVIPSYVADEVRKVSVTPDEVRREEAKTRHEITAFVRVIESKVSPDAARFIHFGLTSSDVMDTAFSIQLKRSCDILISGIENIERVLLSLAEKYKDLVAVGRTHGIHAEPTTLGLKFLSHYAEFRRARKRLMMAKEEVSFGKISGAVGVYGTIPPEVEDYVLTKFGLKPEPVATQVVPRDRYAFFALTCALLASAIERLALNIRISQMTEIDEINEPFEEEQMGSSVMPHKRNPVLSENLTGLSRVVKSAVFPVLENIPLLMERDISHSSVERVIFPEICILLDFALGRLKVLLEGIKINEEKIKENLSLSRGLILSSRALFELVLAGMPREKAYKLVQKASFDVVEGKESDFTASLLKTLEKEDKKIAEKIKDKLTGFSLKYKDEIFDRVLSLPIEVKIKKQKDVFDPEGKAIADTLRKLGYKVKEVRVGKVYEIKVKDGQNDFIEKVLVNPIVEDYEINLKE